MIKFGGGGGSVGPSPALVYFGSVVAAGTESVLSLSDIPQTAQDLIIVGTYNSTADTTQAVIQFNSDGGGNYDYAQIYNGGSGGRQDSVTNITVGGGYGPEQPNYFCSFETTVFNYTSGFWKPFLSSLMTPSPPNVNDMFVEATGGKWRGTDPVSEIVVTLSAGHFQAGSSIRIYGRN